MRFPLKNKLCRDTITKRECNIPLQKITILMLEMI